jgi:hypothetical protein
MGRREYALGFVQHEIHKAFGFTDQFSVHFNVIRIRVGFEAHFGDHLAVHRNPALGDHFLRRSAGGNAPRGQNFLQSFFHELTYLPW